jgi:tetratricopeptide (TPR) repeat protein
MAAQPLEDEFEQLNDQYPEVFGELDCWNSLTEEVLGDLLRALRRKKGFGLFFVQCNSAQAERVITSIKERFPQKRLQQFNLNQESETLYGEMLERYKLEPFTVACITGVEQVLFGYEDTKRLAGWTSQEIYNFSWKGVPSLLSHLNRQREAFEANLPIALVFLVRSFVIDYFIQRAPDFFDWRTGFFKFTESAEDLQKLSQELIDGDYQEYRSLNPEQRMEKILEIKDKILQLDPADGDQRSSLLREQGRLFESGGDSSQALDCYDRSLTANPQNHKTWGSKGSLLDDLERYEEAVNSYDKALKIKPDFHYAWNWRGTALFELGRNEEAIESYNKALEIKPDNLFAWNVRGHILHELGRNDEAIKSYDKALKIKPDHHYAWDRRGHILHELGRNEEAIESYDKALEIKPSYHYAWGGRGDALLKLGLNEEAIESYDKALEIKPDYHYTWDKRGDLLVKLGRNDEAIKSYDKALEIKPDYHYAWDSKGVALYQLGKPREASVCFAKVAKIQPSDKNSWNNQGYLNLVQDSYSLQPIFEKPLLIRQHQRFSGSPVKTDIDLECCQKSLALFEIALQLDPEFTIAWANRSFPATTYSNTKPLFKAVIERLKLIEKIKRI